MLLKDYSDKKSIIKEQMARPSKNIVFIGGHFFIGWIVINNGLLYVNKISLIFFSFGWLIWAFLIFNFVRSALSTKYSDLKIKENSSSPIRSVFLGENFKNLLMLFSLIAVLLGIILSTNSSFLRFK